VVHEAVAARPFYEPERLLAGLLRVSAGRERDGNRDRRQKSRDNQEQALHGSSFESGTPSAATLRLPRSER
jgi:hypothetical protein